MVSNTKKMNIALYNATLDLVSASKHLSNIQEFADQAAVLLLMADALVHVIQPEIQKMTPDTMNSILQEIAAFAEGTDSEL